jgi:uncharacterized membrane protein
MSFIKLYCISVPLFILFDLLWLGVVAKNFYRSQIGNLLRPDVNWFAAGAFYILFLAGVVAFVIKPAIEKESLQHAILFGALFGLVTYSAYDLTNLAVAKDWPLTVTIVDLVWGTILISTVSGLTYIIAQKIA